MTTLTTSAGPSVLHGRPAFEGANIRTWIGFKHFMYLVEQGVLQWLRDQGGSARDLYLERGLGLEIVDCSVQLPAVLELDDDVKVEVGAGRGSKLAVTLSVVRDGAEVTVLRGKLSLALVRERTAPEHQAAPERLAGLEVGELVEASTVAQPARRKLAAGESAESVLTAEPGSFLWSWRAPYFYCHYSDRVQHSGYVRAMEEVVDRFLADRRHLGRPDAHRAVLDPGGLARPGAADRGRAHGGGHPHHLHRRPTSCSAPSSTAGWTAGCGAATSWSRWPPRRSCTATRSRPATGAGGMAKLDDDVIRALTGRPGVKRVPPAAAVLLLPQPVQLDDGAAAARGHPGPRAAMDCVPYWDPDPRPTPNCAGPGRGVPLHPDEPGQAPVHADGHQAAGPAAGHRDGLAGGRRLVVGAAAPGLARTPGTPDANGAFYDAITEARWGRGEDICTPEVVRAAAERAGLDPDLAVLAADDPEIRTEAVGCLYQAYLDDVFGIPYLKYGPHRFWGLDRVDAFLDVWQSERQETAMTDTELRSRRHRLGDRHDRRSPTIRATPGTGYRRVAAGQAGPVLRPGHRGRLRGEPSPASRARPSRSGCTASSGWRPPSGCSRGSASTTARGAHHRPRSETAGSVLGQSVRHARSARSG